MKRQTGFTILELMITVTILAIMMGYAFPMLGDFFTKKQVIDASEGVYSVLQEARGESVARSTNLYAEIDASGNLGVSVSDGCDPSITNPTTSNACVIVVSDGDASLDPGDGSVDTDDLVLNVTDSSNYKNVTIARSGGAGGITFNNIRGTATDAEIQIRHTNDATVGLDVVVFPTGRIRICRPTSLTKIAGYSDCP